MFRRSFRIQIVILIALAVYSSAAQAQENVFPQATWAAKKPHELGLDDDAVDAVALALGGRGCFVKNGYVIKSWGNQEERTDWYSSAKPVLSTLLFFALQEGKVKSVDQPIADFGWELLPKDRTMTFRHLGSMTSGYARPEAPGAAWAYNDFAIQLYQKTLFDKVFQEEPEQAANAATRFGALGLQDGLAFRKSNRRISASVRDFARIDWFWLNKGKWNDKQILPRQYFDDYMQPQTPKDLPQTAKAETNDYLKIQSYGGESDHFSKSGAGTYGFNWWFNDTGRMHPEKRMWPDAPADAFMSMGHAGNSSVIIPSLNLVVAASSAAWGDFDAGNPECALNQRLKLIAYAGTPKPSTPAPAPVAQPAPSSNDPVVVSGERMQWRPVTLTFRGPARDEQGTPNPFRDNRLDVTFTKDGRSFVVPGFFAADGNAAETGATAGDKWRVHFVPDSAGDWQWSASFREGENVAIDDNPKAGNASAPDGLTGKIQIAEIDKSSNDPRNRGLLNYIGERYLKYAGSGEYFIKGGADSPENFLAYYEFDDTKPTHKYAPHALDFHDGDPTWRGGKGRNIIGSLNYLAGKGVNSFYFLTMNVRGDGKDVWPWTSDKERFRYDCSKLDQWEIVFNHMDRLGMMLHVVTQEQENDQLLDKGELGPERKLYYREIVARIAHHQAITWNLGEENTNTDAQLMAFADRIHALDPYDRPVVVHTFPNQYDKVYSPLLGHPTIDGVSLQTNATWEQTARWIDRSETAGRKWNVCLDEIGPANTGVKPDVDDFNHDDVRKDHLWPNLMAGGGGVEWLFGYKYAHDDINLEDFRSRDHMWELTTIARRFFETQIPFPEMRHADVLVTREKARCFAKPGTVYAIYLPEGGEAKINLGEMKSTFDVSWFDPRKGGKLKKGTVETVSGPGTPAIGLPPRDEKKDWVAVLKNRETPTAGHALTVTGGVGSGKYPAGVAVNIAEGAPNGQEFDHWESATAKLEDVKSARTAFIMPSADVTIIAHFRPAPPPKEESPKKSKKKRAG